MMRLILTAQMSPADTVQPNPLLDQTAPNLDENAVARYFGVKAETVRGWRKRGCGPRPIKLNDRLIRYRLVDLVAWAESRPTPGRVMA